MLMNEHMIGQLDYEWLEMFKRMSLAGNYLRSWKNSELLLSF